MATLPGSTVRLDDCFFYHPKVRRAGLEARIVFIAAICYCHREGTAGAVPQSALDILATETGFHEEAVWDAIERLVREDLFDPTVDGWIVHDYCQWQDTSGGEDSELERQRALNRERQARWRERRKAERAANVSPGNVMGNHLRKGGVSPTQVGPEDLTQVEQEDPTQVELMNSLQGESVRGGDSAPQRKSQIRDDFTPSPASISWAETRCPGVDIARETERFIHYHQSKGTTFLNHQRAWQTWMNNARDFAKKNRGESTTGPIYHTQANGKKIILAMPR